MLPNAQPKGRPRIFDKRDKARAKASQQRSVYATVSQRGERRCRCCGRKQSLHHHHIVLRSMGGEDSTENVLLLCAWCRALVHARQLWIEGRDANKRLWFDIHEAAVVDVFGSRPMPLGVRIITEARR